jgi:arabinofuranosyltransferase
VKVKLPYIVILIFGLVVAAIMWPSRLSYPIDDTFITFRYAENLANGFGLVWNPGGPPTEGYTNFLYVLLLTPFASLDLLLVAQVINVIAVLLSAIYIFKLASVISSERSHWIQLLAPLLYLAMPATWANAFSGMETVVFGALLLTGFYYVWHNETSYRTAGYALFFLASLTRPEGALLAAIVGIVQFVREDRWKTLTSLLLGFVIPIAIYYVAKYIYFGYWLPNSFAVKVTQSVSGDQGFFHGLQAVKLFLLRVWPLVSLSFVPFAFRRNRIYVAALSWAMIIIAAYAVPVPLMGFFDRFFYSSEVFLFAISGAAILLLRRELGTQNAGLALGVIVIMLAVSSTQSPRAKEILTWDLDEINERLEMIAQDLRSMPHSKVITFASSDAGIMPYRSRMQHFDLAGLNTNYVAHAMSANSVIEHIMDQRPTILLLSADWSAGGAEDTCRVISRQVHGKFSTAVDQLLKDPRFQQYQPTASYLTGVYDYAVLLDTKSPKFSALDSAYKARIAADIFFVKRLTCIN